MDEFLYRAGPWFRTLIAHNWPILGYLVLSSLAAVELYLRPTRRTVLLLYGLGVLAFAFEYEKHGISILRETTTYLFSLETSPAPQHAIQSLLIDIMPLALHLIGICLVLSSAVLFVLHSRSLQTEPS